MGKVENIREILKNYLKNLTENRFTPATKTTTENQAVGFASTSAGEIC